MLCQVMTSQARRATKVTHVHVQVAAEDAPQDALERGHPRAVDSAGDEPVSEEQSGCELHAQRAGRPLVID